MEVLRITSSSTDGDTVRHIPVNTITGITHNTALVSEAGNKSRPESITLSVGSEALSITNEKDIKKILKSLTVLGGNDEESKTKKEKLEAPRKSRMAAIDKRVKEAQDKKDAAIKKAKAAELAKQKILDIQAKAAKEVEKAKKDAEKAAAKEVEKDEK